MLLVVIVYAILGINDQGIDGAAINAKEVGIALFGPYVLAVELASMLLLAGWWLPSTLAAKSAPARC
ncbi:NADH-ubiquinone oxidoreductase subunit J [Klebsiella pneumoniae]|uniref:NADH-ubiquinone oxidoreductase subunit J n=1 Tax=Klebsiella pneumoniae TaxID=573 RepID=A0A2X3IG88_KLEPN|nr:NADH-ubiquinone oxidoreductase subunit J [Klebsiella pneumoniae]